MLKKKLIFQQDFVLMGGKNATFSTRSILIAQYLYLLIAAVNPIFYATRNPDIKQFILSIIVIHISGSAAELNSS